jgi:hypothetical protein
MMAAVAVIVVAIFAGYYSRNTTGPGSTVAGSPVVSSAGVLEPDDQQLIHSVSTRGAATSDSYRKNLEDVNAYIADAKKWVDAHPDDADAREALMQAYQQKQMLYQMAIQDW